MLIVNCLRKSCELIGPFPVLCHGIWSHWGAKEGGGVGASKATPWDYSSIPGNRNWQIETADWNLDVRLDI